jgi:lysophospholipase L1-like esterase
MSTAASAPSVDLALVEPEIPLRRAPLTKGTAHQLYPIDAGHYVYDALRGFTRRPNASQRYVFEEHDGGGYTARTNALALREDSEPAEKRPDLRVLVTGDSHTDGACENSESFANRCEALLAAADLARTVEVLNAGNGSYTFDNYLGVLERFAGLRPRVLVVCVYGGNDWGEALAPWHYHHNTERPRAGGDYDQRLTAALRVRDGWGRQVVNQSHNQYLYFAREPAEVATALRAGLSVTAELRRQCARDGIRLVVAYLPPLVDVQRERLQPSIDEVDAVLGLDAPALAITDELADRYLAWCAREAIETLDLRPLLREHAAEPLYWRADLHLSVRGHELVGAALAERLASLR